MAVNVWRIRNLRWMAIGLVLASATAGCRSPGIASSLVKYEFRSGQMGTMFTATLFAESPEAARASAEAAFRRIADLEEVMSDYQADSELMRLCQEPAGTPVKVSDDLFLVLQRAEEISRVTEGAFDATIGPSVRLWRFSRKRKVLPSAIELAEAKAATGWKFVKLDARTQTVTLQKPGMRLDLGGIAKGYAADAALKVLKSRGMGRALVAASGDIAVGDPPPGQKGWKIGIAGLTGQTNFAGTLLLRNAAVSTSGDAEQSIEIGGVRFSHILDPATGLGLTNRIQATVVAPEATTTDALATSVCVLGPRTGLRRIGSVPGAAALVLTLDAAGCHSFQSPGFSRHLLREQ